MQYCDCDKKMVLFYVRKNSERDKKKYGGKKIKVNYLSLSISPPHWKKIKMSEKSDFFFQFEHAIIKK